MLWPWSQDRVAALLACPPQPLGEWSRVLQTVWTDNSDLNTLGTLGGGVEGKGVG